MTWEWWLRIRPVGIQVSLYWFWYKVKCIKQDMSVTERQEDKNCTFFISYIREVFLPAWNGHRPPFSHICISITFLPLSKELHLHYGFIICQVFSFSKEITWQLINWKRKSTSWGLFCSKGSVFSKIKFPTWRKPVSKLAVWCYSIRQFFFL